MLVFAGIVLAMLAALAVQELVVKPLEADMARVRTGDVFIVSFPKSGNTWLRLIAGHLWTFEHGNSTQLDLQNIENLVLDLEYGPNRRIYSRAREPRIFKSHQPFGHARPPCDVTIGEQEEFNCACPNCPDEWRRIAYVVRDARDAMCSYLHFKRQLKAVTADTTMDQFVDMPMYPGVSWVEHVQSYLDAAKDPTYDVHIVRYEDLKTKSHATVRAFAQWAGLPSSDEAIEFALRSSQIDKMRRLEEKSGLKFFDRHYKDRDPDFRMMRRGVVGGWQDDPGCLTKGNLAAAREVFGAAPDAAPGGAPTGPSGASDIRSGGEKSPVQGTWDKYNGLDSPSRYLLRKLSYESEQGE